MHVLIEIIGWIAALLILAGYALITSGKVQASSLGYQLLNVFGAAGFIINSGWNGAMPSVGLNIVWLAIGLFGLVRVAQSAQVIVMSRGSMAAALTFGLWGLVPIYWKQLLGVPAYELIAHRIVWSMLFLAIIMAGRRSFAQLIPAFTDARLFLYLLLASVLLASNWTMYVWAVNAGHVIDASFGYFLAPLLSVLLGFAFLHERLRPLQWTAIAFAVVGVMLLLSHTSEVPWIAVCIGITWGLYGILKKQSQLAAIPGLTFETLLLFPFAAGLLLWKLKSGTGALGHVSAGTHAYLFGLGILTAVPLLLFSYGAQRIRLVTLGLLQFIAPSVQFLIGLLVYHEKLDSLRLQACVFIWFGLLLYIADSFWVQRSRLLPAIERVGTQGGG